MSTEQADDKMANAPASQPAVECSPALRRLIEEVRIENEVGAGQFSVDRSHNRYDRQHNRHNR